MNKILLIGDFMLDHYIFGNCNRISPEAPVPVVEVQQETHTLGGAGNVLKNLLAFNMHVDIIGVIGNDQAAVLMLQEFKHLALQTNGIIQDDNRHTSIKTRVLANNHQLIRIDKESIKPITEEQENMLIEKLQASIEQYKLVVFSDYAKGTFSPTFLQKSIQLFNQHHIDILVDPKGADFSKYEGVSLIKPNKKEASIASGVQITDENSLLQACKVLQQITKAENIVITLSEQGIAYYNNDQLQISKTKPLQVIDVTGAGDTVLAALAWSISSGQTLAEACHFANQAASVVVSKVGSATTTFQEINEYFPNHKQRNE